MHALAARIRAHKVYADLNNLTGPAEPLTAERLDTTKRGRAAVDAALKKPQATAALIDAEGDKSLAAALLRARARSRHSSRHSA